MKSLKLVKSENFGMVQCDFYRDRKNEISMTREQIGQALNYSHPNDAIRNIHDRYPERLDKFSTSLKLSGVEGGRTVTREVIVYNSRGIYEICRFSRQPKADIFMDWVWDVIEQIRKTGSYSTKPGHFPWLDALGPALLKDERMGKGLPRIEQLRLRAALLREAQEETGFDYTKVIAHIESGAQSYEEKAKLAQSKADAKKAKEDQKKAALEADPAYRQSMKTLVWIREEYARCGEDFAFEKNGYLHIRPALVSEWAIKNRIDKPMVLKELIRRGDLRKGNDGRSTVPTRINKEVTVRTIGIKCEAVKNAVCLEGVTQESVL